MPIRVGSATNCVKPLSEYIFSYLVSLFWRSMFMSPVIINSSFEYFCRNSSKKLQNPLSGPGDKPVLVGAVSFGVKCGDAHPLVFTKVSYFLDWIHKTFEDIV
ncbi:unnamed protein product [Medioppia subpectinata]|uniref:Peptidase S1 domain-containing protein n=1 Tax=Medioppia subpectinata TaxID=1979941 RepID=A0A7R9Q253_9ACAR|nr:unnamed protein product [Medioppia subpectinata]CAG2109068.1 unnamed protein product [Medioppia subpectinata]